MHCPTCRADNAATTRFCTSCGAVLVEEAPGGGRRRVLRPWGLRRDAPLTISPDILDLAPEPAASEERVSRLDLWLAGGVAAIVLVVGAMQPWLSRTEAAPTSRAEERIVAAPAVVATPVVALVKETRLAAPALVERKPARPGGAADAAKAVAPLAAPAGARIGAARGVPAVPVAYAMTQRDAVFSDGRSIDSEPPAASAPLTAVAAPQDRWQALREDLRGCEPLGLFDRATCEQRARLAHCDGHWGHVAACPEGRKESGQ